MRSKILLIFILGLIGVSTLLRFLSALYNEFQRDEFQCVQAAYNVWRGLVPYRDFWENHTPLTYMVLQPYFWFLSPGPDFMIALRLGYSFGIGCLILFVFYKIAYQFLGQRLSALWSVLTLSTLPIFNLWYTQIRPDVLLILLFLLSVWILLSGTLSPRRIFWVGFLLGLAWLTNIKALFFMTSTSIVLPLLVGRVTQESLRQFAYRQTQAQLRIMSGYLLAPSVLIFWYWVHGQEKALFEWIFHFNFVSSQNLAYHPVLMSDDYQGRSIWWVSLLGFLFLVRFFRSYLTAKRWALLVMTLLNAGFFFTIMPRPNVYSALGFMIFFVLFSAGLPAFSFEWMMSRALIQEKSTGRLNRVIITLFILLSVVPIVEGFENLWTVRDLIFAPSATQTAQMEKMKFMLGVTYPHDPILDGYSAAAFRPQAYFFGNLVQIVVNEHRLGNLPPRGFRNLAESITESQPALVVMDQRLSGILTPELRKWLGSGYLPVGTLLRYPDWMGHDPWSRIFVSNSLFAGSIRWPGKMVDPAESRDGRTFAWTPIVAGRYRFYSSGSAQLWVNGKRVERDVELDAESYRLKITGQPSQVALALLARRLWP